MSEFKKPTFEEVFPTIEEWRAVMNDIPLAIKPAFTHTDTIDTVYYLLFARYQQSSIASNNKGQFINKLNAIMFQYGPTWEVKLDIQGSLRALSADPDELFTGAKQIMNHAYNPSTEPSTATLNELTYIDQQNTSTTKKSKLGAYGELWSLLSNDITEAFVKKFEKLFIRVLTPTYEEYI